MDYIFELKIKSNDGESNKNEDVLRPRKKSREKTITKPDDDLISTKTLDNEIGVKLTGKDRKIYVDYGSAQVENFLVSEKPYQQLSDHFGLSVDLKFVEDPN